MSHTLSDVTPQTLHQALSALDARLAELREDLKTLAGLQPIRQEQLVARTEQVIELHAALRNGLLQLAQKLDTPSPSWDDRQEFELQLAALHQEFTEQKEAAPRRRLVSSVAQALSQGTLNYLPSTLLRLGPARQEAVTELLHAAKGKPPPLPEPTAGSSRGTAWLRWLFGLPEPEQSRLFDVMHTQWPKLVSFLEEVRPEKFTLPYDEPVAADLPHTPSNDKPPYRPVPTAPEASLERPFSIEPILANPVPVERVKGLERPVQVVTIPASSPVVAPEESLQSPAQVALFSDSPVESVPETAPTLDPSDTPAVSSRPAPPPAPQTDVSVRLPDGLTSFSSFAKTYWIGTGGACEPRPWVVDRARFVSDLRGLFFRVLFAEEYACAYLAARALEQLQAQVGDTLVPSDVRTACVLSKHPFSPSADPSRAERIYPCLGLSTLSPSQRLCLRVWLGLEALGPSRTVLAADVDRLIRQAEFESDALAQLVSAFLKLASEGQDAVEGLRKQHGHTVVRTRDQVDAELRQQRQDLHRLFREKANAAGGTLKTKHAILVWRDLMEELSPLARSLFPNSHGGLSVLDPHAILQQAARLTERADRMADQRAVFFEDRKRFDREIKSLLHAIEKIADLSHERDELGAKTPGSVHPQRLPLAELASLSKQVPVAQEEAFLCRLLLRAVGQSPPLATASLDLAESNVGQHPRFADLRPSDEIERAAVLLLEVGWQPALPNPEKLMQTLLQSTLPHLREVLAALDEVALVALRQAIKACVDPVLVQLQEVTNQGIEMERAVGRQSRPRLSSERDEYPPPAASVNAVEELLPPHDRLRLVNEWLLRLIAHGERSVRATRETLPKPLPAGSPMRELIQRSVGETTYAQPRGWLSQTQEENPPSVDALLSRLLTAWMNGVTGRINTTDRTLRTEFSQWVFGGNLKAGKAPLYKEGSSESVEYELPTTSIRRFLHEGRHNPSFVPQLGQYASLVVLTPEVKVHNPQLAQSIWSQAARHRNCLVVVLLPGLEHSRRSEILAQAVRREVRIAVVDDIDLLRLINPARSGSQPSGVLGLLEIILEQQELRRVVPFARTDGQHIAREMFVGRKIESHYLALTERYSRLFSGRKLGKSALFAHVRDAYDNQSLPSGQTLRVMFVSVAGISHEQIIVSKILDSLHRDLSFEPTWPKGRPEFPADQLEQALAQYRTAFPSHSLLVLLDEADVFFEDQLLQYDRCREACLSFRMRSSISQETDSQGLPRVRFVVAGYRVTGQSRGAWANWAEVLRLLPLTADEAAWLIGGPLGRMGLDASPWVDDIAFRCGYLPSIVQAFGQTLMGQLERREELSLKRVSEVFDQPQVQEEIGSVVWRNFQGNSRHEAMFAALCQALMDVPPFPGLANAAHCILEQLRSVDPDLGWLGANPKAEVEQAIAEFVSRALLVRENAQGPVRLKFPHHLAAISKPVAGDELSTRLRKCIHLAKTTRREEEPRGFLSAQRVESLVACMQNKASDLAQCIIAGWHWPESLWDAAGGIVGQLGLFGDQIVRASQVDAEVTDSPIDARLLAVVGAGSQHAKVITRQRPIDLPPPLLCGGADLLRWAIHHEQEQDGLFEFVDLGRLSQGQFKWWFQRRRGLEFNASDAISRMWSATSGIPLLVRRLDQLLCPEEELSLIVDQERLEGALAAFQRLFLECAKDIAVGPRAFQLAPREQQILRLLVCKSRAMKYADFTWTDLEKTFPELQAECPIEPLTPDDRAVVQILQMLGLIPIRTTVPTFDSLGRITAIPSGDALLKLVDAMPLTSATA
jgi:hypothetical protein